MEKISQKERSECERLIDIVPSKGSVVIVYGERGVGKTVFLMNLFKCILSKKYFESLFFMRKSVGCVKQLYHFFSDKFYEMVSEKIILCDIWGENEEEKCSSVLKTRMTEIMLNRNLSNSKINNRNTIFIVDDILNLQTVKDKAQFAFLSSFFLLSKRLNIISFISFDEDSSYPFPSKESSPLLWIADSLIRIKKVRRLRELYLIDLSSINYKYFLKGIDEILLNIKEEIKLIGRFFINRGMELKFINK